jgi:hypothetical protein
MNHRDAVARQGLEQFDHGVRVITRDAGYHTGHQCEYEDGRSLHDHVHEWS